MKRIVVAGGAGFIGAHLCRHLLDAGHAVVCIDNLVTGRPRNLHELAEHPRFEFRDHDITEPMRVDVDQIYHLASPASPVHYQADGLKTLETNFVGTRNLLELAEHAGARLLLASTSEVYGDPEVHPQTEGYWGHVNPIGPRSCYDEGKRVAEALAFQYQRQRGVAVRVVRIFNTYGPLMRPDDGRVVSNFIIQALRGEPLAIYGDGSQTRSFCYVSDLVDGLVRMMEASMSGPVNLGNPREVTVLEIARMIIDITGSRSELEFRQLPTDDPRRRRPDITLAREHLGWQPRVPLEQGLLETSVYFRALLDEHALLEQPAP